MTRHTSGPAGKSCSALSYAKKRRRHEHKLRFEQLESRLFLSGFAVTHFGDSGAGSLRDAIERANASVGADVITFAKGGTIKLRSNLPAITDDLIISAGTGRKVTIDGSGKSAIFSVTGGTKSTIVGLNLTGGFSSAGGAAFLVDATGGVVEILNTRMTKMMSSGAQVRGGAIAIVQGEVFLKSSVITLSTATSAQGEALGGAIYNAGILTIEGSRITKNAALGFDARGGGIFSDTGATLTIKDGSSVDSNTAQGVHGIRGSNGIKGANGARGGPGEDGEPGEDGTNGADGTDGGSALAGGIFNNGRLAVLSRSTVSGNTAVGGNGGSGGNGGAGGDGGAGGPGRTDYGDRTRRGDGGSGGFGGKGGNAGLASAGGIYSGRDSLLTIEESTISNNSARPGIPGGAGKGGAAGKGPGGEAGKNGEPGTFGSGEEDLAQGGGILTHGPTSISRSQISRNSISGPSAQGGGIFSSNSLNVEDSRVESNRVTALNGVPGAVGQKGANGARGEPGEDGEDGEDGENGGDGGNGGDALGGGIFNSGQLNLARSAISGNILRAGNGGNGGNGGAGGNGGPGGPAFTDYDGNHYPAGKVGYGGSGGNGGKGGAGGNALGAGIFTAEGAITVETGNTMKNNRAVAGLGGKGGKGGAIGSGRRGDATAGSRGLDGNPGVKDA